MGSEINKVISETEVPRLYNSPLELGIRSLLILDCLNKQTEIETLMFLDYLSLNTKDIGGPDSLHAPIPHRGVQVYARKEILSKGIIILISKQLIDIVPTNKGICYQINKTGNKFLEFFTSEYFEELKSRVKWVVEKFNTFSNAELNEFVNSRLDKWGGEFVSYQNN
jgi:hypothetical protein